MYASIYLFIYIYIYISVMQNTICFICSLYVYFVLKCMCIHQFVMFFFLKAIQNDSKLIQKWPPEPPPQTPPKASRMNPKILEF